jgi:hypothetical protein
MIDDEYLIKDFRNLSDFKIQSFSKYNKLHVKKELLSGLITQNIESACFWSVELICSCFFKDLWEVIFLFSNKYIHIANIEIPIYLYLRYDNYLNLYNDNDVISMRNDPAIRKLFSQIIVVCCMSKQYPAFELIKVNKDLNNNIYKAQNTSLIIKYYKNNDPQEFLLPINEFIYHLNNNDVKMACYWLSLIIENDSTNIICSKRNYILNYPYHLIWIIWDIIFSWEIDKCKDKVINYLYKIFIINYKHSSSKKNIYLLYFIVELLCFTNNINIDNSIIKNKDKIQIVESKINEFYKDIKVNEVNHEINYLFYNL